MPENFELLDIGQIEIMHQQVHDRLGVDEADCGNLRMQHDSLAAELVKRGIGHDTEIICPESELAQKAPNYRRGFTDDICTNCAFGQLFPFCNLYKADYVRGDTCDSFRYFEVLELEPPHGFLIANGKQTAFATNQNDWKQEHRLIVSGGEVFGIAEFDIQPSQIKSKEFDTEEWLNQHRVTSRERRQWWPKSEVFYVYRLKNWYPYEGIKLYEGDKVINEPELTSKQWKLISSAKQLPKQITLLSDAVSITDNQEFVIDSLAKCVELDRILSAAYQVDVKEAKEVDESIPLYSLALIRNPRMRVSKKNIIGREKQEGDDMPFGITRNDEGEYCVINTDTDEIEACHETEEEAEAQLVALRINVEDGESSVHPDKPKKRKPKKKKELPQEFEKHTGEAILQDANKEHPEKAKEWKYNNYNWESLGVWYKLKKHYPEKNTDQLNYFIWEEFYKNSDFTSNDLWISDIFDKFLIIDNYNDKFFRVDYMTNNGMEIVFTPQEQWTEIGKNYHDAESFFRCNSFTHISSFDGYSRRQSEKPKKFTFMDNLKSLGKSIQDFVKSSETQEKGDKLFVNDVGIGQKLVNGELWHFTYSTNAFEDREGEIFSTKSLEDYVVNNEINEEKGFFNFWHINAEDGNYNTDFAKKEWQGVVGRFLIEAGPYLKDEKGKIASEFFKEFGGGHPEIAPEGWGCSPEFRYLPEERVKGVYEHIWITRTSTLPRFAAANIWTETRQVKRGSKMTLTNKQEKAAVVVFGDDFVSQMTAEAEEKTTELEQAKIAHKNNEPSGQPEAQTIQLNIEELAAEVGKQFQTDLTPMVEAMGVMATELKELKEWRKEQEKGQDVKDKTESPRFVFELKRASEQKETIVTDDDGLKNERPKEAAQGKNDPWSQMFNTNG